jgi:glycosyltransferase involved in cell wall biosynthesis
VSPAASIVLPLLAQEDGWLAQSVASALGQTVPCEVVAVTAPATPAANRAVLEAARRRAGSRLVVAPEERPGFAAAINTGIRLARSDRVGILLSDDSLDRAAVELCLAHRADIVATGLLSVDGDGAVLPRLERRLSIDEFARRESLERKAAYLTHFFLFRKAALVDAGGLDETLGDAPGIDDYELIWTLLERGATVAIAERPLYRYRVHEGTRLTLRAAEDQVRTLRRILDKHGVTGAEQERLVAEQARWFGRSETAVVGGP